MIFVCPVCKSSDGKESTIDENLARIKKIWDARKVREIAEALIAEPKTSENWQRINAAIGDGDLLVLESALRALPGGRPEGER